MSANFLDDLAFAAAWLYRTTGEGVVGDRLVAGWWGCWAGPLTVFLPALSAGESQYLDASQAYLKRSQYQRNYFVNWDSGGWGRQRAAAPACCWCHEGWLAPT